MKRKPWHNKCVPLLGVTRTPVEEYSGPSGILPRDHLLLISEFAEYGSLRDYLQTRLAGNESDWTVILQVIRDLIESVRDLHEEGVLHRQVSSKCYSPCEHTPG